MLLHYHTVNHDENVFGDDAMDFDVTRAERMPDLYNQLRSFGIGQHFCIGTHLARLELRIMFEEIIPRLRNPQLKEEPKFVRSFFVNAMKEMHITFDPELARADALSQSRAADPGGPSASEKGGYLRRPELTSR